MKWYNESKGVIAACEQLEPVFQNGHMRRGRNLPGGFVDDEKGIDILHRVIPGQVQVQDDDPRVRPAGR